MINYRIHPLANGNTLPYLLSAFASFCRSLAALSVIDVDDTSSESS